MSHINLAIQGVCIPIILGWGLLKMLVFIRSEPNVTVVLPAF
jgi:hypothetical protein